MRQPVQLSERVSELRARVVELERANAHLRQVAEAERRRADAAQDALARAYRVALGGG
jgi:hypothetical protein